MSLKPLTTRVETKKAFRSISRNLTRDCIQLVRFVGWKGGRGKYRVYWNPRLRFWTLLRLLKRQQRYWCCFGTKDATKFRGFSITGQINPPVSGFDRRVGGAFVSDGQGRVYIAHSGKIGGGRSGIGKSAFVAAYRSRNWQRVAWPDKKETELIVIGRVDGAHLQDQIAHFVAEIDRFKKIAVTGERSARARHQKSRFSPDFSGRRKSYSTHAEIESQCDHGPLISALEGELQKHGIKAANDVPRDLYVLSSKGRVRMLFEAKTDLSTSSIYGAVGQLMLHGAAEPKEPRRIFVAPGTPKPETVLALKKLGIEVLTYRWDGDSPTFLNLTRLLSKGRQKSL
jgi:hypothetical protein